MSVVELIQEIDQTGLLCAVAADFYGNHQLKNLLMRPDGETPVVDVEIVGIPQGWRLNGVIAATETILQSRTLRPARQELMRWAVGNAKVTLRGNAMSIEKAIAGRAKIDPLMALFDAVWKMMERPTAGNSIPAGYEPLVIA